MRGWAVHQRLEVLDDAQQLVASLRCELQVNGDGAILSLQGVRPGAGEWVVGPNVRAALGNLIFQHGQKSAYCRSLTDDHAFTGTIHLLANGRRMRVTVEAEMPASTFLTPLIGKNHSLYERLVPGQVWGLRARVPGEQVNLRWRFEVR